MRETLSGTWQLALLAHDRDEQEALEFQLYLQEEYTLEQIVWVDEFGKRKKPPQRCVPTLSLSHDRVATPGS